MDRLPKLNSSPMGPSVVEWFEKSESTMFKVKDQAMVIPLRLSKGAFAMYQQLRDEVDMEDWWLFRFYGISTFVDYLMPNLFLCK